MFKDEFIKIVNSKKIIKVEADKDWIENNNPEWCETITIYFDDNTSINVNAGCVSSQECLWFD